MENHPFLWVLSQVVYLLKLLVDSHPLIFMALIDNLKHDRLACMGTVAIRHFGGQAAILRVLPICQWKLARSIMSKKYTDCLSKAARVLTASSIR